MGLIRIILIVVRGVFRDRSGLTAENLALRYQFAILQRRSYRPRLRKRDRNFWVWFSRCWSNWRSCLAIVQLELVVRWNRQDSKLYWRWK